MVNYKTNKKRSHFRQRIIGISFLILSAIFILLALSGEYLNNGDVTVILLLIPMGVYALFTKCKVV